MTDLHDTLFAYYKGTMFPLVVAKNAKKEMRMFEEKAKECIVDCLKKKMPIADIKDYITCQLDILEEGLVKHHGNEKAFALEFKRFGGSLGQLQTLWYLDVAILLKLKVIENDEMNGWLAVNKL
jgi:hypothetical protein